MSIYEEPLRTCIHALKYRGCTQLCIPLGTMLARTYLARRLDVDMIIPVPLHRERQRQRGYNQAHLLAAVCARELNIPLGSELLTRIRATQAQAHLSASERKQNVAGAFRCTPSVATGMSLARRILIVDDVSTTGATLEACATTLFAAGVNEVWGLVLARPW